MAIPFGKIILRLYTKSAEELLKVKK